MEFGGENDYWKASPSNNSECNGKQDAHTGVQSYNFIYDNVPYEKGWGIRGITTIDQLNISPKE